MGFYRSSVKLILVTTFLATWLGQADASILRIYHIDVEQGDATLLISPSGRTLLIDSGKNTHGTRIKAVLQAAGVSRIDHFVATHYHEDHYGGIDELASDPEVTIGIVYDRGDKQFLPAQKLNQPRYQEYDTAVGHRAQHLTRGMTIPLEPELSVTCISSGGVVLGEDPPIPGTHENDLSVSLLIQFGAFRYFIGGDIQTRTESKIAARDLVLEVDLYQANHHGAETSSSRSFVEDLRPTVVVISNGNHGGYMHPRQATLTLFTQLNPAPTVFQTNKYLKGRQGGNVPDAFIGDPQSVDTDGTILVTVDSTQGTYIVSYGATASHTFSTKGSSPVSTSVVIHSLLPNPFGSDLDNEEVSLRNAGTTNVDLSGWVLRDTSGRIWPLVSLGTLTPGSVTTIRRNRMPMSLNNPGDEIFLVDGNNAEQDRFSYVGSSEGVVIPTGHRDEPELRPPI